MEAQFSEWHHGWLVFIAGWALKTRSGVIRVFGTKEAAELAGRKSQRGRRPVGRRR